MIEGVFPTVLPALIVGVDASTAASWMPVLGFALAAGVVSAGATVAVERFGGRVGGILGTVPTTIMPKQG